MKETDVVLFDIDGTLLDTREFIFQAYEFTLAAHGFAALERAAMAPYIGRYILDIYQVFAPQGDVQALFATHSVFQEQHLHLVKPFPDVVDVLGQLNKEGIRVGAVTSRFKNTHQTLTASGLKDLLEVVVTGDDVINQKPHPEPVLTALERLGVKPEYAWMVGDADIDILAGHAAGVRTVGVTYGFGGRGILDSKPDFVIDDIKELVKLVLTK